MPREVRVIHAIERYERLTVEPPFAHYPILVWAGTCGQASHGRGSVRGIERVLCLRIYPSLLHQSRKAFVSVQRGERLQVIRAQLVDYHVHHKARNLLGSLRLGTSYSHQDYERGQESVSVCRHLILFLR